MKARNLLRVGLTAILWMGFTNNVIAGQGEWQSEKPKQPTERPEFFPTDSEKPAHPTERPEFFPTDGGKPEEFMAGMLINHKVRALIADLRQEGYSFDGILTNRGLVFHKGKKQCFQGLQIYADSEGKFETPEARVEFLSSLTCNTVR